MKNTITTLIACVLLSLTAGGFAQNENRDLVEIATNEKRKDEKINQQREAEFVQNKQAQQHLLERAQEELKALEQRSEVLEKNFADNERKAQQAQQELLESLGALKEVFGHLTASAGDLRSQFSHSIVSAQYPERDKFLNQFIRDMESDSRLPETQQIEKLWQEMLLEIQASAQVLQFDGKIVLPNGKQEAASVYRIGNFNLVANKKYLSYTNESHRISALAKQPPSENLSQLDKLDSLSGTQYIRFSIDPTGPLGGPYLKAIIASPSLIERWRQGGLIGYIITLFGLIAFALALWRFVDLNRKSRWVEQQVQDWQKGQTVDASNLRNPLTQVLKVYQEDKQLDVEALEMKLTDAILKQKPTIEKHLSSLKIISMVSPLLGLLGTVAGMIVTFQAITLFGAGDPKTMAGGISSALVTTVLGLCVAIPTVLAHAALMAKANQIMHVLRQQSAGLIAMRHEEKLQG